MSMFGVHIYVSEGERAWSSDERVSGLEFVRAQLGGG
jgi:hypothetical protein